MKRHQSVFRKVIKSHKEDGKVYAFDREWPRKDRKPLLNEKDLNGCTKRIANTKGQKHTKDEVNIGFRMKRRKRMGAYMMIPRNGMKPHLETI